MLASKQTNSSSVKKNSTFMETVQDKLKDIKNFSNWSAKEQMIAVGAVGVMVGALLPFVAVALPVAATGAIVALTLFFAYKAVEYTFKGLKWSAEKTVDGAKNLYETAKGGAVHARDKVGEGVDSLKKRFKERDRVVFYNHAKEGDAIEKMTKFPEEDRKKAGEIKHELKAIFADKGDNSKLVKNILSEISLKIDLKIAEEAKSESIEHTPKWQVQKNFIKHLDEKDLRVLIKQKALPSDVYFIDRVFSEHYDEIKRIVKECKTEHKLSNSMENLNKVAGKYGTLRDSIQFGGSNVEKQLHEPFSSDLGVLDKTATIGQKPSGKQSIPVAPPKVPESPTLEDEWSKFVDQRAKKHVLSTPKSTRSNSLDEGTLTRSNSSDSGMGSGSSTPTRKQVLPLKEEFDREREEKLAKRRASLDQPSAEPVNSRATATPGTV
ncbi:hypothetical protein [Wolbachia endosymbiont (group A) of Pogonocherus hispidulus]|uniref:actin-bundling T4SS effector WalE1 family protein n=1 Tax=Wolbachia endosymbiont (group A) of Pogonocherus hispidulus TaxID=3066136 RepID=UPI00333E7429